VSPWKALLNIPLNEISEVDLSSFVQDHFIYFMVRMFKTIIMSFDSFALKLIHTNILQRRFVGVSYCYLLPKTELQTSGPVKKKKSCLVEKRLLCGSSSRKTVSSHAAHTYICDIYTLQHAKKQSWQLLS